MTNLRTFRWRLALWLCLATVGVGCQSGKDGSSGSLASVQIQNRTTDQVKDALLAVFRENGYDRALAVGQQTLVFEKESSALSQLAYGGWITDQNVWVRVRVTIASLGPGSYRVDCQATMIRNKGDAVFEEEVKMSRLRRKPFQEMLDEVAKRLQ